MADSIDRGQLKEELHSVLGRDAKTGEHTKGPSGSAKKKRPKPKKTKNTAGLPQHGESNDGMCPADPTPASSDRVPSPAPSANSHKPSHVAAASKKSPGKKDKGPGSAPAATNKTRPVGDLPRKSGDALAQTGKQQNSREGLGESRVEAEKGKVKSGVEGIEGGKELGDKQEALKMQSEAPAKQQKPKERNPGGTRDACEVKNDSQKAGKTPAGKAASEPAGGRKGQGQGYNVNNNRPKPSKPGEEELTEELMESLAENKMHVLKKPNQKFRNARYFCRLCDFHLDQIEDCVKHMKDNRHCRRKEISEVDAVLRLVPAPSETQLAALTLAVDNVWNVKAIGPAQQAVRQEVVTRLEGLLQQHIPDVLLYMYGSSLTGFGLKEADINVDLCSSDKDRKLTFLLKEVHSIMRDKKDCGFSQVRADFSAKVPVLLLTDDPSGLLVTMAIHCYSAHCSSELLAIYSNMDARVGKLGVAFRYWAHLCGLDRQKDDFIPPQALNIMVIYFLQALTPQLIPIINPPKVSGEDVGDFRQDEPSFTKMRIKAMKHAKDTSNEMSVGELWVRLLRFYSLEFDTGGVVVSIRSSQVVPRNTKPWNCKKLAVEDPYMMKKNITRMVNNSRIYEYWQDSIRKAYYYFGLPRDLDGNSLISEEDLKAKSLVSEQPEKKTAAEISVAQKSSTNSTKTKNCVTDKSVEAVSIAPNSLVACKPGPVRGDPDSTSSGAQPNSTTSPEPSDRQPRSPSESRVEPGSLPAGSGVGELNRTCHKSNSIDLSDTSIIAGSVSVLPPPSDTTDHSLSSSASPSKTPESGVVGLASTPEEEAAVSMGQFARSFAEEIIATAVSTVTTFDSEDEGIVRDDGPDNSDQCKALPSAGSEVPSSPITDDSSSQRVMMDSDAGSSLAGKADLSLREGNSVSSVLPNTGDQEPGKDHAGGAATDKSCLYDFDKNYFTDGKGPTLVCTFCEKEGHLKNSCPDDELPEVLNLPEMTEHHLKVLCETLNLVPSEVGLSENSIRKRWQFLYSLQEFIQYQFDDAELTLFGSTCNGFGFDKSDMDICMTFSRRNGKIDKVHVIETLARRLKNYGELCNVQAISTAKVPIVKFTIRDNQLEGDISLYNTLAQQNTKLLHCYSKIDPRVRILGYAIKTFAKVCDIGDASRGSLSSYAYILMMLYYLQQVQPPVIPVLQELYKGPKKPELIVEDCDAWFMEDLTKLNTLWPEKGKNTMSVAELWLGFLRFYVEEFNYKEFVVSIRQRALLTRFEKLWNGTCVAVEDPFDLSHNLGSGLTRKMNNFIFKTFINGRMLYGSPIDHNMDLFKSYQRPSDYFFDTELLSENRPPNIRGCRRCGKIGHLVRACPLNRKDREEEEQKQRQQRQQQQQQHMTKIGHGSAGRFQQPPMIPGKPQERGYATPRQNQGQQQYRERDQRDRWHSNSGGGSGGNMNNRHHGGGPHSAGNTNRNSSATSSSHTPSYGYNMPGGGPLLDRPPGHHHQQQQPQQIANHTSHTYHNSNYHQKHPQQYQHQHPPPPQQHHRQHPQQQQQQQFHRHQTQHQHQQQQLRHHQQEQQRQAAMAVVSGNSRGTTPLHGPSGFSPQPMMTSTPRPLMTVPHQQQQQHPQQRQRPAPPPPGFPGIRQNHAMQSQQHHQQQLRGACMSGLLPPPNNQYFSGGSSGGGGGNIQQGMNPVVQSLFSSAQGHVLNMDSNRLPNKYH